MSDLRSISESVGNALSEALAGESEMVTRWVALIEVMDANGERAAYSLAPVGSKSWDRLGLLTFAVHLEQASAVTSDEDTGGE
jgi:hypothetical protein